MYYKSYSEHNHPVHRGDIYYVNFGFNPGSVIGGIRPALVIQNDTGNRYSTTLIVAAISTRLKKFQQPTHIYIGRKFGLTKESMLLLEQITTINKSDLLDFVGHVSNEFMFSVNQACALSVGL